MHKELGQAGMARERELRIEIREEEGNTRCCRNQRRSEKTRADHSVHVAKRSNKMRIKECPLDLEWRNH